MPAEGAPETQREKHIGPFLHWSERGFMWETPSEVIGSGLVRLWVPLRGLWLLPDKKPGSLGSSERQSDKL